MLGPRHFGDDFKRDAQFAPTLPVSGVAGLDGMMFRCLVSSTWGTRAHPPIADHIAESLPKKSADSSSMSA